MLLICTTRWRDGREYFCDDETGRFPQENKIMKFARVKIKTNSISYQFTTGEKEKGKGGVGDLFQKNDRCKWNYLKKKKVLFRVFVNMHWIVNFYA